MKYSTLLSMLVFVLVTSRTYAQEATPQYQLKLPTVEEYLAAIPSVMRAGSKEPLSKYAVFNYPLFDAVTNEIYAKYPDFRNEDAALLNDAYLALREKNDYWYDRDIWVHAILLGWINQQSLDLAQSSTLNILNYKLTIVPRDYNNNGTTEWLVHVDNPDFTQDIVLSGQKGQYEIIESPLPWFGCCFMYYDTPSGFTQELKFEDITGDGLPEWVVALGGVGGGQKNHGWIYILQWQNHKLVDIAPHYESYKDTDKEISYSAPAGGGSPLMPWGVEVNIENIDADKSLEILVHQQHTDNWDCNLIETRTFKWDEQVGLFQLTSQLWEYIDSAGCSLRQAQAAMWEHNYQAAIPLFEQSLAQYAQQKFDNPTSYEAKSNHYFAAYASVRLALAYSLSSLPNKAKKVLNSVQIPDDKFMSDFVQRSQEAYQDQNSFHLCIAMYSETSLEYARYFDSYALWLGLIDNDPASGIGAFYPSPHPELGGCDVDAFIAESLKRESFDTQTSPLENLVKHNITVDRSFHADLNRDGTEDWLVWFGAKRLPPMLFLSNGSFYAISHPQIAYPDEHTQLAAWELPDEAGTALLRLYFDNQTLLSDRWYLTSGGGGGPRARCVDKQGNFVDDLNDGWLEIWQLQGKELTRTQQNIVCEAISISDLFPNGKGSKVLRVWYGHPGDDFTDYPVHLATLTWDSLQKQFIAPIEITPHQETDQGSQTSLSVQDVRSKIGKNSFDAALLTMIETLLKNTNSDMSPAEKSELVYYRALTLEALNRADEALAQYSTIYSDAPSSSWGQLARLHIKAI
jgi:hypothetical protein